MLRSRRSHPVPTPNTALFVLRRHSIAQLPPAGTWLLDAAAPVGYLSESRLLACGLWPVGQHPEHEAGSPASKIGPRATFHHWRLNCGEETVSRTRQARRWCITMTGCVWICDAMRSGAEPRRPNCRPPRTRTFAAVQYPASEPALATSHSARCARSALRSVMMAQGWAAGKGDGGVPEHRQDIASLQAQTHMPNATAGVLHRWKRDLGSMIHPSFANPSSITILILVAFCLVSFHVSRLGRHRSAADPEDRSPGRDTPPHRRAQSREAREGALKGQKMRAEPVPGPERLLCATCMGEAHSRPADR